MVLQTPSLTLGKDDGQEQRQREKRSSEDGSDVVSRSDSLLVTVLGLGEVKSVLVCTCGATSEDTVVWMVLSILQAVLFFTSHSIWALMA